MQWGRRRLLALGVALLALCTGAAGSGLQVSPTLLTLQATQNADGLWLSNTGTSPLHAQIRVYQWTQEAGEEKLVPSRGLVISPPMLALDAQQRQLVRVIRVGAPPTTGEVAYRVILDELPVDTGTHNGLQFVLRYSLPVFVEPQGTAPALPQLHWSLQREGDHAVLQINNTGGTHAQIVGLAFTDATQHRTEVAKGLLGYVLPGATMHWTLQPSAGVFAAGGTFEAMINGEKATQTVSLATRPR